MPEETSAPKWGLPNHGSPGACKVGLNPSAETLRESTSVNVSKMGGLDATLSCGDRCVRKKLTFASEKGDRVPAYLFVPLGAKGKVPDSIRYQSITEEELK